MIPVLIGAGVMLIGVITGLLSTLLIVVKLKTTNNDETVNVYQTTPHVDLERAGDQMKLNLQTKWITRQLKEVLNLDKVNEDTEESKKLKEKLLRALEILRENPKGLTLEQGDELEDLIQNVVDRMNP